MTESNMTGSENFCLRSNGFEGNANIYWKELQTYIDFCDVTLACDDKQIKTHKLVVSSCSPHPIIYLRRVKYRNLQNLIDFMYQGEANVAEEDLPSFLEVAEDLNVRGLCERNTENCNSKRENTRENTNQNINHCPKKKITPKTEKVDNSIDLIVKNSFINNYDDNQTLFVPNEIMREEANEECTEDDAQNIITAVVIPDAKGNNSCDQCDFKTRFTTDLKRHIQSVHEGVRYPCDQCGYKAKLKHGLQQHVKSIHEKVSYPCNQCEYKATQKSSLRTHQLKRGMRTFF